MPASARSLRRFAAMPKNSDLRDQLNAAVLLDADRREASDHTSWSHRCFLRDILSDLALKGAALVVTFDGCDTLGESWNALILEEALVRVGNDFGAFSILIILKIEAIFESCLLNFGFLFCHYRWFKETLLDNLFVCIELAKLVVHGENVARTHSIAHIYLILDLLH